MNSILLYILKLNQSGIKTLILFMCVKRDNIIVKNDFIYSFVSD